MTALGFDGKTAVVAGGGGSGMGSAVANLLHELGAAVTVLDLRPPESADVDFQRTDLGDPLAIESAVAALDGPVDVLFNCQGVSGVGMDPNDVVRINFLGVRELTEALLPKMRAGGAVASISSAGGLGWSRKLEVISEMLDTDGFDEGVRWCEQHGGDLLAPAFPRAYAFSKQALIVWTMRRAVLAADSGVRINCSSPGSTRTSMASDFPDDGIDYMNQPSGRESSPTEQAWPLIFLNSPLASYVNGVNLVVDGGNFAARSLGLLEVASST